MQIVSGDITRDITGEIVYLKAYKQMVGEVTGYSTEKGTATVKLCDTGLEITVSLDDIESTGSTQPHRAFNSEVHILGTRYSIRIIDEDDYRYDREADGWCDPSVKEILIFNYKPLIEAFDKATPVIGERAKKLFEDFAKECDIIYKKQQETFDTKHEKLKEQYRSGEIDWKKYNSLFKKLQKEVNEEADNNRRALFGGGVSGLQDIYDAVSKGTFRDTGQVTYGHGSAYYTDRRRTNPNCSESLANYASLCVGHPELIDILAEDYPEIVTALRGCVEAMLKEVPK